MPVRTRYVAGWCVNLQDCKNRAGTTLGSSSQWAAKPQWQTEDGGENGMISPDPKVNPLFANWTTVFAGYCDGGSRVGNVVDPVAAPGGGVLYFRGRATLDAMIDLLLSEYGMAAATNVI